MGEETALGKFLAQNETACPPKSRDAREPCPAHPQSLQLWPPPGGFRRGEDGALEQPYLRKRDDVTGCQPARCKQGGLALSWTPISLYSLTTNWSQAKLRKRVRGKGTIQSEEEGSQIPDSGRGWNHFIITVRYEEGSYPDHWETLSSVPNKERRAKSMSELQTSETHGEESV